LSVHAGRQPLKDTESYECQTHAGKQLLKMQKDVSAKDMLASSHLEMQ